MSILRRGRAVISGLLVGASLFVVPPAQAYEPGTAVAYRVVYNAYTGAWDYKCSFSGWRSGAKVTFHCRLYDYSWFTGSGYKFRLLDDNKGSWTPPPSSRTRSYSEHVPIGHGALCVRATALSVDGGDDSGIGETCF